MAIKCEYDYCISNRILICTLKEISIDEEGMCENRILVNIPGKKLEKCKRDCLAEVISKYPFLAQI